MIQTNCNRHIRRKFSKAKPILDLPDLLEIQKKSYKEFLQKDTPPDMRKTTGIQALSESIYPIRSYNKLYSVEFDHYKFDLDP